MPARGLQAAAGRGIAVHARAGLGLACRPCVHADCGRRLAGRGVGRGLVARAAAGRAVLDFAGAGNAVVVVSSELEELAICHRIVVMVEGRTIGELQGPGVTEEQMLSEIYNHQAKEEAV